MSPNVERADPGFFIEVSSVYSIYISIYDGRPTEAPSYAYVTLYEGLTLVKIRSR